MDEIANKGLEVKRSRKIRDSDIERISVTGYDIELPREHVESELKKLFSSCGEITDVHIPETRNSSLWSHAFIYFVGEGTADKALQLNGSDMGGWAVDAEADPFPKEEDK
ncbi:RNA-binding domain superfamily [Arabidopsis thaliana x Arabidopsis arenosa]|uniref:RNA-binding domain superfamily n=1 Tax=Arabidopsis thaliana x Arabidopsis arenosa TaxID=1240361 RepID=A0A8T2ESD8_9BRAS|nr:RNA-binding domain superfamily [Arabidopsis thaliana x Arabidopsis arenosa]